MVITSAQQLAAHLDEHAAIPFDWAAHNCCHFVAAWVRQATGRDPMAGLAATPGEFAARRLVLRLGGSLPAAWTQRLGRAPIAPALAQVGDIVAVPLAEGRGAVGICAGRHVAVLQSGGGIAMLPMQQATHVWRLDGAGGAA